MFLIRQVQGQNNNHLVNIIITYYFSNSCDCDLFTFYIHSSSYVYYFGYANHSQKVDFKLQSSCQYCCPFSSSTCWKLIQYIHIVRVKATGLSYNVQKNLPTSTPFFVFILLINRIPSVCNINVGRYMQMYFIPMVYN